MKLGWMKLNFATKDERDHLASKQSESYQAYMKAFVEVALSKALMPWFFLKDNGLLFVKIFLAALMFMITVEYTGDIYREWELGTQAGKAAFLLMKLYFGFMVFNWLFPKDIVKEVKDSASRLEEIKETKQWLKKPNMEQSV